MKPSKYIVYTTLFVCSVLFSKNHKYFRQDSALGWTFIPSMTGETKTNSLGFRGPEPDTTKDKIMIIGDSFVSNIFIDTDSIFASRLDNKLNNVQVLNFGVDGFGTVQEYLLLKKYLKEIDPVLIIFVVYLRNDFSDNIGGYWYYKRPFIFRSVIHNKRDFEDLRDDIFPGSMTHTTLLKKPPELYTCRIPGSEFSDILFSEMITMTKKVNDFAIQNKKEIIFFLAPSFVQTSNKYWRMFLDTVKDPENYKRDWPDKVLMKFAEKNKIEMYDLYTDLAGYGEKYYNIKNQHWNEAGNRIVSDIIYKIIMNKKCLHKSK